MNRRTFLSLLPTPFALAALDAVAQDAIAVKRVHVIFKTHLDIGYTDFATKVLERYFEHFIPVALDLADAIRAEGRSERFVWTTGSWLVYEYLERGGATARKRMEQAIASGDIVWHALPFTLHSEAAEAGLIAQGLKVAADLDRRFGRRTTAGKMTDVPGHTRAIVPILQDAGVELLHVGVNSACPPPDVPPVFLWRDPRGREIVAMFESDYGGVRVLPGGEAAVAIAFTGDNHGPQTPDEIAAVYQDLRDKFPGAELLPSHLNAVAEELRPLRENLPVITQEIGDTWVHGIGSDPLLMQQFRELCRSRWEWAFNETPLDAASDLAFSARLLLVPEHTWGLDVKGGLHDWETYSQDAFLAALDQPNYQDMEKSWAEKRARIDEAVACLPEKHATNARVCLDALRPQRPDASGMARVDDLSQPIEMGRLLISLDPATGALIGYRDADGDERAAPENPLALFAYQTFSSADFDRFMDQYLTQKPQWAIDDFSKTGLKPEHCESRTWLPRVRGAWSDAKRVLVELSLADDAGAYPPGAPRSLWLDYSQVRSDQLEVALSWFDKPPTRLPEAIWLSFVPTITPGQKWILEKLGQYVSPQDVVSRGNRHVHSVWQEVSCAADGRGLRIESSDAPLVACGKRTLLDFSDELPAPENGVHFCLCNNVWGTNFRLWFSDDMKFRFALCPFAP